MIIGNKEFKDSGKMYIMGILNVTPDSFSDGGRYMDADSALFHAQQMIKDGCDIIDIGAESTRPGFVPVSELEELHRLIEPLRAIKDNFDIPISIDTYKPGVAKTVIMEGADMINDIRGLRFDESMAKVIAASDVAYCVMHNRPMSEPYRSLIFDVLNDLEENLNIAKRYGISKDKLIVDPGIGFGKNYEQNLVMIKHMDELKKFGLPMLLGTSRKSVIGKALDLPVNEREEGTAATTVLAVMKGYSFVRVHDVRANRRVIDMTEAILSSDE